MTDVHTREQRSRNMAAIRSRNTKPEVRVRRVLHAMGFRFRLHRKDLPGRPDIVLPKYRTAIFVHGCFWHCHRCKYGSVVPATRAEFWAAKRGGNVARDRRHAAALRRLGWRVAVLWECEVRTDDAARAAVRKLRLGAEVASSPMSELGNLPTEARNPASDHIDEVSTLEMLRLMHAADEEAVAAVGRELPQISTAVDAIAARIDQGGRLFYLGAGTSGRLGVLDASECPPTFNTPPELVQGIIAGGDVALRRSIERAEDNPSLGARDLEEHGFDAGDVLVGIAASGRTPYVLGGLEHARKLGALTIGLTCVPGSPVATAAEIAIVPATGPEVVTGSTRMKAGTATKLVLNMLSTGALVRLGYVYGNLMVNVQPTNTKLADRAARIIATITGLDYDAAAELLARAESVKTAVVMKKLGVSRADAEARLAAARGRLKEALR